MTSSTIKQDLTVRERPILFSGAMVRAILDGKKTQTRSVVKLPRGATFQNCAVRTWDEDANQLRAMAPESPDIAPFLLGRRVEGQYLVCNLIDDVGLARVHCPHGQPGDRPWVRETWSEIEWTTIIGRPGRRREAVYRAGPHPFGRDVPHGWNGANRWKPSIHMPRWASRLSLEITGVRVERLSGISEDDAKAEGVEPSPPRYGWEGWEYRTAFAALWNTINASRGYGWDANPWVWVIEFRRVTP